MENFTGTAQCGHDKLHQSFPRLPGICKDQESNAGFERYWKHYEMMKEWMEDYVTAWREHRTKSYGQRSMNLRHSQKRPSSRHFSRKHCEESSSTNQMNKWNQTNVNSVSLENRVQPKVSDVSTDHGSMDEDDPQFEVEVSEELKEFFMKSQKYREEREKRKLVEEKLQIENVEDREEKQETTEAPKERPGARRNQEMKTLYGRHAPMIQGLETAIQMEFDHILDREQPELWPSIALNL